MKNVMCEVSFVHNVVFGAERFLCSEIEVFHFDLMRGERNGGQLHYPNG